MPEVQEQVTAAEPQHQDDAIQGVAEEVAAADASEIVKSDNAEPGSAAVNAQDQPGSAADLQSTVEVAAADQHNHDTTAHDPTAEPKGQQDTEQHALEEDEGAQHEIIEQEKVPDDGETREPEQGEVETYEQVEGGELEYGTGDEAAELPLETEEFEELPEHEEEQVYEEEQHIEEYGVEYGQDEQEYGHEEQDYAYEVEDADHTEFEPDFDQLHEDHDEEAQGAAEPTAHTDGAEINGDAGGSLNHDAGTADGGLDKSETADDKAKDDSQPGAADAPVETKLDDSKRKHRPISWNDWKGVDEKPKPDTVEVAAAKVDTKDSAKKTVDDKKPASDGKSSRKRSRSRSPSKPSTSKERDRERERSKSRGTSRGRSAERDKDKGKSSDHPSSSKRQQSEKARPDSRKVSPPRRATVMGPGPVIKSRIVPVRTQATPVLGPDGRVVVRRPVITRAGVTVRRQSPPPGFVGRGLVPVVPLRAGPLRAGLPPGEILVPQLSRRASFPPGRGPVPLDGRLISPANLPSDMRLAAPRDVRGMQIVHVPREQLRDIRTLRPVPRDTAIPLRGAAAGPRGEPILIKGGPALRAPAPTLQRSSRDPVPLMRGTLKDSRSPGGSSRHEEHRLAVPPDMHGRLQGARQSPSRDRLNIRSTSAPIQRGMDDHARSRHSAALPVRRPPSPQRGPSGRHSPPRLAPGGSVRRPADPSMRGRSPPPKRSRHDQPPSVQPSRGIPGPPPLLDHPRGGPPGSSSRPSASITPRGGPTSNGGRPGPPGHMQSNLPPPPTTRQGSMPPPRNEPGPRSQPREERGRMMHGAPGTGGRGRSPPRDDRREMERREQERRDSMRRESDRREQERRNTSQRSSSARMGSSMGSSRDDRRMAGQPQQQPGQASDRGQAGGGWSSRGQPSAQQPGGTQNRPQSTRQQPGHMIQQLPAAPAQQHLPGPPAIQQQAVVQGLQQPLGMTGLGMQQAPGVGNGILQGSMNWNAGQVALPSGTLGGLGNNQTFFQPLGGSMQQQQQPAHQPQVPTLAGGPSQMGVQKMGGSMMGGSMQQGAARVDEDLSCWFYIDPQNQTQGPCSITQFRKWLSYLEVEAKYAREYQQFRSVMVWKDGSSTKFPLWSLLQSQGG